MSYGADINATDIDGNTPLHRTVREHCPSQTLELFVRLGAKMDALNKYGNDAILLAASANAVGLLQVLLQSVRAKVRLPFKAKMCTDSSVINRTQASMLHVLTSHCRARMRGQ